MYAQLLAPVSLAVNASGAATAYSVPVMGRVLAVLYTPGTLDTGADLTITTETTLQTILTLTNAGTSALVKYPRVPVHDETGAAATLDGTRAARDYAFVCNERIKIVVAQGGVSLTGSIAFVIG
jgi:hypothetical protein